jgi:hypothetical protein
MPMLRALALVLAIVPALAWSQAATPPPVDALFARKLLLAEDPSLVRAGARSIEHAGDPRAFDLAAEVLATRATRPAASSIERDALAWLMRTLGSSGNGGYRATIERAMVVDDSMKADRFGTDALAALAHAPGAQFVPGQVSLPALRAQVEAEWDAMRGDGSPFTAIRKRQTLASLLATVGRPDGLVEAATFQIRITPAVIPIRGLGAVYAGQGIATLDHDAHGWFVSDLWRDVPGDVPPYAGAHPIEAAVAMTSNPGLLRAFAAQLRADGVSDAALLDRLAARLALARAPATGDELEAIRDLCRVLGRDGAARHVPALEHIAADFGQGETRRIARAALSHLR